MKRLLLFVYTATLFSTCMLYTPQNISEWQKMTTSLEGSGCIYFRGNARPYADVSMLAVSTWGKEGPKFDACLKSIPEAARALGIITP